MARDEHWLVYHPDLLKLFHIDPATPTFLLLTIRGDGAALRHYRPNQTIGRNDVGKSSVFGQTVQLETRFFVDPPGIPVTNWRYWWDLIQQRNRASLKGIGSSAVISEPDGRVVPGPAKAGSQLQIQTYVNERPDELNRAILARLPEPYHQSEAHIRWLSPLKADDYAEFRDGEFLRVLNLAQLADQIRAFWPLRGPLWDGLGLIRVPGVSRDAVLLVEAKSYAGESEDAACRAEGVSRELIARSMDLVKDALNVDIEADWLGSGYQYANRLAHLWWLRSVRSGQDCWLVYLCFENDPIEATTQAQFEAGFRALHQRLGLPNTVPNMLRVYLPAVNERTDRACDVAPTHDLRPGAFAAWVRSWMNIARFDGPVLHDASRRIDAIVNLWSGPVPGIWQRSISDIPNRLLGARRYTRGDLEAPHSGEHQIEHEILNGDLSLLQIAGRTLVDGVNAFPFVRDAGGGRECNVEADLAVVAGTQSSASLYICEVKSSANNPWYAVIENLLQVKLARESAWLAEYWRRRAAVEIDSPPLGAVMAPLDFYEHPGQKRNCIPAVWELLDALSDNGVEPTTLLVWNGRLQQIRR